MGCTGRVIFADHRAEPATRAIQVLRFGALGAVTAREQQLARQLQRSLRLAARAHRRSFTGELSASAIRALAARNPAQLIGTHHGRVIIKGLLIRGIIGINPDERVRNRTSSSTSSLCTDISRAATVTSIVDTANYKDISKQVIDFVEVSSFFLVERLVTASPV